MAITLPAGTVLKRSGSYLNPGSSWTLFLQLRQANTTPSGGTVRIYWEWGNVTDGTTPYIYLGSPADSATLLLEIYDGSSFLDSAATTPAANTWTSATLGYDASTHITTFALGGVTIGTVSADLSAVVFPTTDESITTNFGGESVAHVRVWQALLSASQIAAEAASPIAVLRTNLLADTPLPAVGYYADQSGNGRDWSLTLGTPTVLDDPYTPPNQSFATAIDLGTLPRTLYQRADFGGSTKTLWYSVTPSVNELGPFAFGDLTTYIPTTSFWTDASTQVFGSATNVPAQIPTAAGTPIAIKVTPNVGNPVGVVTLNVQNGATDSVSVGDLAINDSTDTYPLVIMDSRTAIPKRFVHPFAAGEGATVLQNGTIAALDAFNALGPVIYSSSFTATVTPMMPASTYIEWLATNQIDTFVAGSNGAGGTHGKIVTITAAGVVGTPLDVGSVGCKTGAPTFDLSAIYFAKSTSVANTAVLKITNPGGVVTTFLAGVANYFIGSNLFMLTDDTLLIPYERASFDSYIERRSLAGTLLNTYALGSATAPSGGLGLQNQLERIFGDPADPAYFWIWYQDSTKNYFERITVATGAREFRGSRVKFIQGVYQDSQSATPSARFGADFSCVPFIVRGSASSQPRTGRRGIYVPTRGVGGSEGGGQTRFADLNGYPSVGSGSGSSAGTAASFSATVGGRIIRVPVDGPVGGPSSTAKGMGKGRAIYVPPNAEGNTPDGRQRIIVVPIGTEGYSHR